MDSSPRAAAPAVGSKYHPDGTLRAFPGASWISFLEAGPVTDQLLGLQAAIQDAGLGRSLVPVPPASFHVTLLDLVCDQERLPGRWPTGVSLEAPLEEVEDWIRLRLAPQPSPRPRFRFQALAPNAVSLLLLLRPADPEHEAELRGARDLLAERLGFRHPGHEHYGFHLTVAYRLRVPDAGEEAVLGSLLRDWEPRLEAACGELTLPPPVLVHFPDMGHFEPLD